MFKRKGADLLIQKEITLLEALCGYEFLLRYSARPLQTVLTDSTPPDSSQASSIQYDS